MLENISIARTTSWASWKRGKEKLMLCDAYSWLHTSMARYSTEVGLDIGRRDYTSPSLTLLQAWCRQDTEILAHAVCGILNFIASEDLGNLRPTGSGQSHAAWRKRFMPERSMRVHDNAKALAAEREAMHTGRAEAWRLGRIKGPVHELDLHLAYCRIAANNPLPATLAAERASMDAAQFYGINRDWAVLADVDVQTDEPLVPTTREGRVLWPVGSFKTTLWDPEVRLLLDRGQRVSFNYCWLYKRGIALADMSNWLINQMARPAGELDPAVRRMLKHWARTLVGRMALRYRQWEYFGEHPIADLCASYEPDPQTGETHKHLRIGHTMLELASMQETKSSCPMVPGWVQSRCRVILWELIQQFGEGNVLYMDTDGLLVGDVGREWLSAMPREGCDFVLAEKGTYRSVTIHGVRNVEIGSEHRLSGIPKSAIRLDDVTWEGETWTGLERALGEGHTDYVAVTPAEWKVVPEHHRREPLDDGQTRPYALED